MTKETFARLERETKADIIAVLSNGQIPLAKGIVSPGTLAQRIKLGIGGDKMFYATGRLIEHIQVKIILLSQETASRAGKTYLGRVPF
jgi:2-keto-3-deoxy-6-phosphogluconate aldolase